MHLDRRGIEYRVVDVMEDAEAFEYVKSLGYQSVPVVVTKDLHWSGLRLDLIDEIIAGVKAA